MGTIQIPPVSLGYWGDPPLRALRGSSELLLGDCQRVLALPIASHKELGRI